MLMVLTYGKGRIFHTTLGHDLGGDELRRLHHYTAARRRMGSHRQGHAEGSERFPDGGEREHSSVGG